MKLSFTSNKTLLMGILNVTPDSFSDGGNYFGDVTKAVEQATKMLSAGADIIDIGGESTRPGAEEISTEEEIARVMPVVKALKEKFGDKVYLSIDTYKAEVAKKALAYGADMINSLGGFSFDPSLAAVVADFSCPVVIYHIKGKPQTMQQGEIHYNDVVGEISEFFIDQLDFGQKTGIKPEQFILDPGIGFGKTKEQNLEILKRFAEFRALQIPLAIGVSRKNHLGVMLQKKLGLSSIPLPQERIEASLAETAVAVLNGARIVRTHDVEKTKKFLTVLEEFI